MKPSYDELLLEAMTLGARVEERRLQSGLCGFYWGQARTIVVDDGLAPWHKRYVLCHELVHARHDDTGCGMNGTKPSAGPVRRRPCAWWTRWSTQSPRQPTKAMDSK